MFCPCVRKELPYAGTIYTRTVYAMYLNTDRHTDNSILHEQFNLGDNIHPCCFSVEVTTDCNHLYVT